MYMYADIAIVVLLFIFIVYTYMHMYAVESLYIRQKHNSSVLIKTFPQFREVVFYTTATCKYWTTESVLN